MPMRRNAASARRALRWRCSPSRMNRKMAARRATTRPSTKRWPAISAAAPVIARSWKPAGPCAPIRRAAALPMRAGEAASEYRQGAQLYLAPHSIDELVEAKAQISRRHRARRRDRSRHPRLQGARSLSGGDLDAMGERAAGDLGRRGDALTIGGGVTYTTALPYLDRHFPSFAALVRRIGSRQIRNIGTLRRQSSPMPRRSATPFPA